MPYKNNIPQPTDQLSTSQADILNNFGAIETWCLVNHYDFNSAMAGKHKFVSLPNNTSNPGTAANEIAIFTKTDTNTSAIELWWQNASNGAVQSMTSSNSNVNGTWMVIPAGYIFQFGTASALTTGAAVTFPIAFTTTCLGVQVTTRNAFLNLVAVSNTNNTGTVIYSQNVNNIPVFWMAVGY